MTTLTITAKGQVTLRKELFKHLGVGPGDEIDIDLIPGGTKDGLTLTIEEINDAAATGWASAMDYKKDDES